LSLIKNFKKIIPSFRHKKDIYIFDKSNIFYKNKKNLSNVNFIKRKKKIYLSNKHLLLNNNNIKLNAFVTKLFLYYLKPYKKFILCQSWNNFNVIIPGLEYLNVGTVIYNLKWNKEKNLNYYYKGLIVYAYQLPLMSIFSNVYNFQNNKITYAKAGGTFCKLKRSKKSKNKLLTVTLPSGIDIFINKMIKVYLGKNINFNINSLVEGKYGYSFHSYKKIKVRGVAMNPVDHPNGGRTKTVQPERSPWNWIAKKKK